MMNRKWFSLLLMILCSVASARAELRYLEYDLSTKTPREVTATEVETNLRADDWHTSAKMLFVQSDAVGDATYYISVFELTKAQAHLLGWLSKNAKDEAYAQSSFSETLFTVPAEFASLKIPTVAQWQAYADKDSQVEPYNLHGCLGGTATIAAPSDWWSGYKKKVQQNTHGVIDIFGNVAEYTATEDGTEGLFYGGWAATSSPTELDTLRTKGYTAKEITSNAGNQPRLGVRLIYVKPEELTYTAKVTLDDVVTQEVKGKKVGTSIVLDWPTDKLQAGHGLFARTVTPADLTFSDLADMAMSAFKLPAADVTLAFTSKKMVAFSVAPEPAEGGSATIARQTPADKPFADPAAGHAYVEETLVLSATPADESRVFKEWRLNGQPVTLQTNDAGGTIYTIKESDSDLAFQAVFDQPLYTLTVKLDGAVVREESFPKGAVVTVDPSTLTLKAGHKLYSGPKDLQPFTFAMPAENTTYTYTSKAYVNLAAVVGSGEGTVAVAKSEAFIGSSVRFTATATNYHTFKEWRAADGTVLSTEASYSYDVPDDVTLAGTTITLTAIFDPPPMITAKVTLNGRVTWSQSVRAGTTFTFPAPTPTAGYRLTGYPVQDPEGDGGTHLGEADVTFAYTQTAYVRLVAAVSGEGTGTARVDRLEQFVGKSVHFYAEPEGDSSFKEWKLNDIPRSTARTFDYIIPTDATPGSTITMVAVFDPPPKYTVTLYLNNVKHSEVGQFAKGEQVIYLAPTLAAGHRFTATPPSGDELGGAFTMGSSDVQLGYTTEQFVTIVVQGRGSVSDATPTLGTKVKLTAKPLAYERFKEWQGPAASTASSFDYTVKGTAGETQTFTAVYDKLPRVVVQGGSASVQDNGTHMGEGYYTVDTVVKLSAHAAPAGYKFSHWLKDGVKQATTFTTLALGAGYLNQTVTFTAQYVIDTANPATGSQTTQVGVTYGEGSTVETRTALGWEDANTTATKKLQGNAFTGYQTAEVPSTEPYALLNLEKGTISYASSAADSDTNKTTILPLKRIRPDATTLYPSGETFYMGIYETTVGHFRAFGTNVVPMQNTNAANKDDTYPYVYLKGESSDAFFTALNAKFDFEAKRPSFEQIEAITAAGTPKTDAQGNANTFTGAGPMNGAGTYGDPNLNLGAVVCGSTASGCTWTTVASQGADNYGFYDLWGNALEWLDDGTLRGGYLGLGATTFCNFQVDFTNDNRLYGEGTVRPTIVVPQKLTVTFKDSVDASASVSFEVLPNQEIRLMPQVRTGYNFVKWTASDGQTLSETDGYWKATVTQAVTFTAQYTAKPVLKVTYQGGCTGPSTVLPGEKVTIAATSPAGATLSSLTLSPSVGTVNVSAGTITFNENASGSVTVTASYTGGAPTSISATYSGCTGPAKVTPGQKITVPTTKDGCALTDLTVSPAWAAAVDPSAGTITFSADLTGVSHTTVTATYAEAPEALVRWVGCEGAELPDRVAPGQVISVPAELNGRKLTALTIDKGGSANSTTGKVTFAKNLSGVGVATVTATYESPRTGYRLRLR